MRNARSEWSANVGLVDGQKNGRRGLPVRQPKRASLTLLQTVSGIVIICVMVVTLF